MSFLDEYQGDGQPSGNGGVAMTPDDASYWQNYMSDSYGASSYVPDGTDYSAPSSAPTTPKTWNAAASNSGNWLAQLLGAGGTGNLLGDTTVAAGGAGIGAILGSLFGPLGSLASGPITNFMVSHGDNSKLPPLTDNGTNAYTDPVTGAVTAAPGTGTAGLSPQGVTNPPGLTSANKFSPTNPYGAVDVSQFFGGAGSPASGKELAFTQGADGSFSLPGVNGEGGGYSPFVPDTMGLNTDLSKGYFDSAAAYDNAASQFDMSPLFGAVKDSFAKARTNLGLARDKALGDINASFARNRVAGSSLAAGAYSSAAAEFDKQEGDLANQEAMATTQAKLQEVQTKADYAQKATQARVAGAQAAIDNALKVANIGSHNAQIQASLTDSSNKLKGVLASIGEDIQKTQATLATQEAQSIRSAVTNLTVSNTNSKTNAAQLEIEKSKLAADKNQGVGNLLGAILAPSLGKVGTGISNSLFGTSPSSQDYLLANLGLAGLPASSAGLFSFGG